jgi:serralysin
VGGGIDKIITSVDFTLASLQDVERISATAGSARINLIGNEITNFLYGNEGQNSLNGGGGNDYLYGYGGADRLNGGAGIDFLAGGAGTDTLVLSNLTADRDRCSDFVSGVDHLEISVVNFGGGLVAGSLDATQMSSSATGFALDVNDRFAFNSATGRLYYDADGNGAAAREFILQLDVGDAVVFTDFVLV